MIEAYPLQWPAGWNRTEPYLRKSPAFQVTLGRAIDHLYDELDRLGATDVVVSSDMRVRLDGKPYADSKKPENPGVAVYFTLNGRKQCIPCDKWQTVLGNIRAVGLTIEALRGLDRWGAKEMVDAAFTGFQALPPGGDIKNTTAMYGWSWFEVLGVNENATLEEIKSAYRKLAHIHHPDKGGESATFSKITKAYQEALKLFT